MWNLKHYYYGVLLNARSRKWEKLLNDSEMLHCRREKQSNY
jgi:hypothetical protein